MTATVQPSPEVAQGDLRRASNRTGEPGRDAGRGRGPETSGLLVVRSASIVLACLLGSLLAQIAVFSGLEERAHQHIAYAKMRNALAAGTAPTSPLTSKGTLIPSGTSVAILDIPRLHLKSVIVAGTSGEALNSGPGWLRSSVFPGQSGVSVLFGRAGLYGGPFGGIGSLRKGDKITVTTQINQANYVVRDARVAGSPAPAALADGQGRLTLVTVNESLFVPSGVMYVDALASNLPAGPGQVAASVPKAERPLSIDTARLWQIMIGLELLLIAVIGAVWAWHRWGRSETWIVSAPVMTLLAYYLTSRITDLLPNLV